LSEYPFPYYPTADLCTLRVPDPDPWTISFTNGSKLMFWKDGRCTFEGNPDEPATVFYEQIAKRHMSFQGPEGETENRVIKWLRERGYTVTKEAP
jgi:hypothetical protein